MFSFGIRRFSAFKKTPKVIFAGKHTLPDLGYDYNELEPTISGHIMELHHRKHHQAYVNNLNIAEEQLAEAHHKGNPRFESEPFFKFMKRSHSKAWGKF